MNDKEYISIGNASSRTGIGQQTLRKLADKGSLKCYKTPGGQRRFNKQDILELCNTNLEIKEEPNIRTKENFIYTRVSSKKQMDDLSRQIEYLKRPEYSSYILISDVASGINFKRKGLQTIINSALAGLIGEVVVAHRDRLSRFGFDLIKYTIEKAGGKVTVTDDTKCQSSEQELAEDLLSIVHVFSCREMGKRSYKRNTVEMSENKSEPDAPTKEYNRQLDKH